MPPALPATLQAQLDALTPAQQRALTTGAAAIAGVAVGYGLYRLATRLPRAGPYPPSSLPEGAFDVAIVGAGPAGAAAAFYAAGGGARVVLIDRAKFPRCAFEGGPAVGACWFGRRCAASLCEGGHRCGARGGGVPAIAQCPSDLTPPVHLIPVPPSPPPPPVQGQSVRRHGE